MPLYEGDVSEYVQPPRVPPLTLTIDLGDLRGRSASVTARLADGQPITGEFVVPEVDWDRSEPPARSAVEPMRVDDPSAVIGTRLFDALFSGRLRRCWAEAVGRAKDNGSGVRLTIVSRDREIQRLAWELLHDRVLLKGFVVAADGWELTRSVPGQPMLPAELSSSNALRALVVATPTATDAPVRAQELLSSTFPGAEVDCVVDSAGLRSAVAGWRPHVVHVRGKVTAPPEWMKEHSPLLVVLASKHTDAVAAAFARHVPCVIGMRGSTPEQSREMFVENFYRALGKGSTVQRAMSAGRAQQIVFAKALGADWAAPVGYFRSPGGIVKPAEPPQQSDVVPITTTDGPLPSEKPRLRELQVELDMHAHSLQALRSRWQASDPAEWPEFIAAQVTDLESRIAGIESRLREQP